ncbi:MAG: AMP-binding protein [Oscillospiraceae bacterium]|jgi:phenylacetate-coenzyme A ligase PaaK-like adenylate-forming protein|nr:AMP-binding protein [Oscillospiraceae bacterium]
MSRAIPDAPPLDIWCRRRINAAATRENIEQYQRFALRETLIYAAERTRFYAKILKNLDGISLEDVPFAELPFTHPENLAAEPNAFLTAAPHEVSRIVSLPTSGTSADPKRLFFSERDLEDTVDFFRFGMRGIARPGGRVMVFMPGEAHGSVGDLLRRALAEFDCGASLHGVVTDCGDALAALVDSQADCVVGLPAQMLALARTEGPRPALRSVLLSADFVPRAVISALQDAWDCEVFTHFGMTETCFGGAVECGAHDGAHIREPDLLFEIVDPATGEPLPDGEPGELVVTTLTRRAMPLIRYRTGDVTTLLRGECPCGCKLKRLGRVHGRTDGGVRLPSGAMLTQPMLDEAIFVLPFVRAFSASASGDELALTVDPTRGAPANFAERVTRAVRAIPGCADTRITVQPGGAVAFRNGSVKRGIAVK